MGGACYSEMRAGYEVTSDKKNWEIVMGMNYSLFIIACDYLEPKVIYRIQSPK